MYILPNTIRHLCVVWSIKSYLTTGCVIFPLSLSCINNFDWYLPNSTKAYEEISTVSSLAYMEYFVDKNLTFVDWFNDFFFLKFMLI